MMKIRNELIVLFCIIGPFLIAQPIKFDTWELVNYGFAKCTEIKQTGGFATWQRDNFKVVEMLHNRGTMYAYIEYETTSSTDENKVLLNDWNPESCEGGLFKHDKVTDRWTRVSKSFPTHYDDPIFLTNGTDIFGLAEEGLVYILDETTINGWQLVNNVPIAYNNFFKICPKSGLVRWRSFPVIKAIGDTIFFLATDENCMQQNALVKFNYKTKVISFETIGLLPHEQVNVTNSIINFTLADHLGGRFVIFVAYQHLKEGTPVSPDWIGAKGIFGYDPHKKEFVNLSKGIDWLNYTGSGYAGGKVYSSWDNKKIFVISQKGLWQWLGDSWKQLAFDAGYELGPILGVTDPEDPLNNAIVYTTARNGVQRFKNALVSKVGQSGFYDCIHNAYEMLSTPDDGKTLYITKKGMKNPYLCTYSGSASSTFGIYWLKPDPDKPSNVRNLHVESSTYIGGAGSINKPVGTGVGAKHQIFVAGNYQNITGNFDPKFYAAAAPGANNSQFGKVIRMNLFGDTIRSSFTLGNEIHDYEIQNFGKYLMAVTGDFGLAILDSAGEKVLWRKDASIFSLPNNTGKLSVDIDDEGYVVVMRSTALASQENYGPGYFWLFDTAGNLVNTQPKSIGDKHINDVTIKNRKVYVTGFNNPDNLGDKCGVFGGVDVQSAFIYCYESVNNTWNKVFTTFGFNGDILTYDQADIRGYCINVGKDGNLYFLGEAAGGNSVFRWNGKQTVCSNGSTSPKSTLIMYDLYNTPMNTKSAHISYFATINPDNGIIERGQYIIPRKDDGTSNSFRVKGGYIHADAKGYIYIGGTSAYKFAGRDVQHLNGILVGDYIGGDMTLMISNPEMTARTFYGTFSDKGGASGIIKGIGMRDNVISAIGATNRGKMITGATRFDPVLNQPIWKREYAMLPNPFNYSMGSDDPLKPNYDVKATIDDSYLAVWYQDVWNHAQDSLEENIEVSDSIIDKDCFDNDAQFLADKITVCVGSSIVFSNQSIGDSCCHSWTFGDGASLENIVEGVGPHVVSYNTVGEKTISLKLTTNCGIQDVTTKFNYVNVLPQNQSITNLKGPDIACEGSIAYFEVDEVWGIKSYHWTLPSGYIIIKGNGSHKIEAIVGKLNGNISVQGEIECGLTNILSKPISVITVQDNSVLFVVGNETLSAGDQAIKDTMLANGYMPVIIDDSISNATHAQCVNFVIISSSVDINKVHYKFRDVRVPVIVLSAGLFSKMSLTNGGTVNSGVASSITKINITNISHELGNISDIGEVKIYNNPGNVNWGIAGKYAISIAQLDASKSVFFAYESGKEMIGFIAPQRRIAFFMPESEAKNITKEGAALFRRALCWASYSCITNIENTITTLDLKNISLCAGDTFSVSFNVTGSFNFVLPVVDDVFLDNSDITGISSKGDWFTHISPAGFYKSNYFKAGRNKTKNTDDRLYYTFEVQKPGIYNVFIQYPNDATLSTGTPVTINHEEGKTLNYVDQSINGGVFNVVGAYHFVPSRKYQIEVGDGNNPNTPDSIVADAFKISAKEIDNEGNQFIVQLSNSNGLFINPSVIGTSKATSNKPIKVTIPNNLIEGNNYKIRVIATDPTVIGTPAPQSLRLKGRTQAPGPIKGNNLVCRNTSEETYSIDPVFGAEYYIWTIPLGTSFAQYPNQTEIKVPETSVKLNFGTATSNQIIVRSANTCYEGNLAFESSRLNISMASYPPIKPASFSGKTNILNGDTEIYAVSPSEGALSYRWEIPSNINIVQNSITNFITLNFQNVGFNQTYIIKVYALNDCGESDPAILEIKSPLDINYIPVEAIITSNKTDFCVGENIIIENKSVAADAYQWNFDINATYESDTNSKKDFTISYSSAGLKTIRLKALNTKYSEYDEIQIQINIIELEHLSLPKDTVKTCLSDTSISVINADSYQWLSEPQITINANNQDISFVNILEGIYKIYPSKKNVCFTNDTLMLLKIKPKNSFSLTTNHDINNTCISFNTNISIESSSSVGIWSYEPDLLHIVSSSPNKINISNLLYGKNVVHYTIKDNICGNISDSISFFRSIEFPNKPASISGKTNILVGDIEVYTASLSEGATSYRWEIPSNINIVQNSATNFITLNFQNVSFNQTYIIKVFALNNCGESQPAILEIKSPVDIVNIPVEAIINSNKTDFCVGENIFIENKSIAADAYQWYFDNNATYESDTTSKKDFIISYTAAGLKTIRLKASNTLNSGNDESQIQINIIDLEHLSLPQDTFKTCLSDTSISVINADSYQWLSEPQITINANNQKISLINILQGIYIIYPSKSHICFTNDSIILIKTNPKNQFVLSSNHDTNNNCITDKTNINIKTSDSTGIWSYSHETFHIVSSTASNINISNLFYGKSIINYTIIDKVCGNISDSISFFRDTIQEFSSLGSIIGLRDYTTEDSITLSVNEQGGVFQWNITGDIKYISENGKHEISFFSLVPGIIYIEVNATNQCYESEKQYGNINILQPEIEEFILKPVTAFSPNNDGTNDFWYIANIDKFPNCEVKIFNRWGQLLFHSKYGYKSPWDGTSNGKTLGIDSYHFIIEDNKKIIKRGIVSIIK